MFKLVASDMLGNVLEMEHYMQHPDDSQIDKFYLTIISKYETFVQVEVTKLKYIEYSQ